VAATVSASRTSRAPLQPTGALDKYSFFEVTPCIGQQYTNLTIRELLQAPNSDELIREFDVTVSTCGVVFLRDQDLTLQKQTFVQKLGSLTSNLEESRLHIHPSVRAKTDRIVHEEAQADPEAFLVSNRLWKKMGLVRSVPSLEENLARKNTVGAKQWHSEYSPTFFHPSHF